jgi:hypothetical protein
MGKLTALPLRDSGTHTNTRLTVIVARGRRFAAKKKRLHLLAIGSSAVVTGTERFAVSPIAYQRRIGASFA